MRAVLCCGLAAVFTLLASPGAYAAPTDACAEAKAHEKRIGFELTEPRVVSAMNAVIQVSGVEKKVILCELSLPYLGATVESLGAYYYVGVTRMLIERSSDAELQAALAHEMAHIVLGHRAPIFELTHHRMSEYEQAADALAARWVGKEGMCSLLKKLRADAKRLPPGQQKLAISELNSRIRALR